MYTCVYIFVYIYIYTYTYIYIHINKDILQYTRRSFTTQGNAASDIYIYIYTHKHIYTHITIDPYIIIDRYTVT